MLEANRTLNLHHPDLQHLDPTERRRVALAQWAKRTADLPDHAEIIWPDGFTRIEADTALELEIWSRLRAAKPYETVHVRRGISMDLGKGSDSDDHAAPTTALYVMLLFLIGFVFGYLLSH
jgi:hypothetical protein